MAAIVNIGERRYGRLIEGIFSIISEFKCELTNIHIMATKDVNRGTNASLDFPNNNI